MQQRPPLRTGIQPSQIKPPQLLPIKHSHYYPPCSTCLSDSYQPQLQNMLYFLLHNSYPKRINNINDQQTRYNIRKKMKKNKKFYATVKCNLDNYHLLRLPRRRRIPMLMEILGILRFAHGDNHNNGNQMKKIIAESNYYGFIVERYVHIFILNCQECKKTKIVKFPKRQDFFYNIYQRINNIKTDRIAIQDTDQPQNIIPKIQLNSSICFYNCTLDSYINQKLQIYQYLLFQKLPKLSQQYLQPQKNQLLKKFISKKKRYCLISCSQGTKHLWKSTSKLTDCNKRYRVPMEHQKQLLNQMLHGKQHRPLIEMIQILKNTFYTFNQTKDYLERNFYFCQKCQIVNQKNPIIKYKCVNHVKKRVYYCKYFGNDNKQQITIQPSINKNKKQHQNSIQDYQQQYYQYQQTYQQKINNTQIKIIALNKQPKNKKIQNKNSIIDPQKFGNTYQILMQQYKKQQQQQQYLTFDVQDQLFSQKHNKNNNISQNPIYPNLAVRYESRDIDKHLGIPYKNISKNQKIQSLDQLLYKIQMDNGIVIKGEDYDGYMQSINYFVIVTKQMKQDYFMFGDCLYVDSLSNQKQQNERINHCQQNYPFVFQNIANEQLKGDKIFILSVSDKRIARRIVGIIIIKVHKFMSYFLAFQYYLSKFSEGNCPQCIYIPSQQLLTKALIGLTTYSSIKKLNELYILHYKQQFIKQLQKITQYQQHRQFIKKCYIRCLQSRSSNQYNKQIARIQVLSQYLFGIQKIKKQAHLLCYSQMMQRYIGIQGRNLYYCNQFNQQLVKISQKYHNIYEQLYAIIKLSQINLLNDVSRQQQQNNLQILKKYNKLQIKYQYKIINQQHDISTINPQIQLYMEMQHQYPQKLQDIFLRTSSSIYSLILQSYNKSLNLYLTSSNILTQSTIQQNQQYIMRYDLERQYWRCSCRQLQHIGIPCSHLMAVLCKYHGSIRYYVNKRWIL